MEYWAATDKGPQRPDNQDRFLAKDLPDDGLLLAVADGIGGAAGGGVAAQMAVDGLAARATDAAMSEGELLAAIREICRDIHDRSLADARLEGMGTTLTTAVVTSRGVVIWAHVGDSRLYLIKRCFISQITRDDNMAAFMVEEGKISREEAARHPARHLLWDCVGCGDCEPQSGSFIAARGDQLLLTTDGLHGLVPEERMLALISTATGIRSATQALLEAALEAGASDNVTAVLMAF